ncbi:MAG: penicillin acylase family protein [Paracoccaceae bacterium]
MMARAVAAASIALLGTGLLVACSVLAPLPQATRLEGRLQAFPTAGMPLNHPVTIHWDEHQIPFVVAETDGDGAFALGLVHAHLRLGQMGVVRRIVQGRLSESAGPLTVDLDHAIRSLDVYRAADEILAAMPPATRAWMDRYVAGVNHGAAHQIAIQPPHEFRVLAIDWEPWTAQDSIALGRASGIDLNWDFLLRILSIPDPDLRDRLAVRILQGDPGGAQAVAALPDATAFAERPVLAEFAELAALAGRSGSNSMVVGPERSATGAALIASDPHLAFIFPNAWIVAGLRSPSYNLVGMMVPGTPVFAFGRNERLAWGGTNLRARTSQLVDVSGLDPALVTETRHRIGVRLLPDARRVTRQTPYGPILSDLDLLSETDGTFAVRWTGHTVTDETTALLDAMRARSVPEFRTAVEGFAFPPLTFLAADDAGNVGAVTAARVPARAPEQGFDIITSPTQSDSDWRRLWDGRDLPHSTNPAQGFIASANNRPAPDGQRPYGGVFLQDERIRRLNVLLAGLPQASLRDLAEIQLDVVSPVAVEFLASVETDLRVLQLQASPEQQARDALLAWDGAYHAAAEAPAIFESFITALVPLTYEALGRGDEWETYAALGRLPLFLIEDLALLPPETRAQVLTRALHPAAIVATDGTRWGDLHRLRVTHVLGNLPIIGRRYDIATLPISGSRETILKTAHDLTDQPHLTMFGAQARHLSDLGDLDENHFVLLGGQDGWINSTTFADQVDPFLGGELIRVPLRPSSISTAFRQRIDLLPDR